VELAELRTEVAFVSAEFQQSERTACKLLGVDRSSYRYEPRPDRNGELREELIKLARQKPRFGYRRLHAILERRGQAVNVKRVYRLYVEAGLLVRRRRRKRLVRDPLASARLTRPNQEWAMDFIVDGLANGRMVRILSVVDAYTRECLALEPDVSLGSGRVTRVLDEVIAEHGRPESLRSDNGPEFCSRRMLGWAEEQKIALVHIQPGRPMQNGHVESFHGRLRDECLNAHWFRTLNDVRVTLAGWRQEYNCERPHSSLGYRTPEEFRLATNRLCKCGKPTPLPTFAQPRRRREYLGAKIQPRISSYKWMRIRGQVIFNHCFTVDFPPILAGVQYDLRESCSAQIWPTFVHAGTSELSLPTPAPIGDVLHTICSRIHVAFDINELHV
jgi:putative transposase